jgi:hypothetical protein
VQGQANRSELGLVKIDVLDSIVAIDVLFDVAFSNIPFLNLTRFQDIV